jgi:hypothetical protein
MPEYGRLHFQDVGTFDDTQRDIVKEALNELTRRVQKSVEPPPIIDWARITECIREDTRIWLPVEDPRMRVSLRFDSAGPQPGNYEIRTPIEHRIERGRVVSIITIDEEKRYIRAYSMLADFPLRYLLITIANYPQSTQRAWRVGISSFREVQLSDHEIASSP